MQVDLILLDFSKAFDKVRLRHLKLLFKLPRHGVEGNWVKSFLQGRTQAIVLEGESKSEVPVSSVPQGSVRGSLFLLCINDLPLNSSSFLSIFFIK